MLPDLFQKIRKQIIICFTIYNFSWFSWTDTPSRLETKLILFIVVECMKDSLLVRFYVIWSEYFKRTNWNKKYGTESKSTSVINKSSNHMHQKENLSLAFHWIVFQYTTNIVFLFLFLFFFSSFSYFFSRFLFHFIQNSSLIYHSMNASYSPKYLSVHVCFICYH